MKNMNNIGSIWRKWDLHFHTPSSYDYQDKGISNQTIIDKLSENNISVIAVTDHHVIDVDRIKDLQEKGKEKNITVLPGIEFRSELGGSEIIHFIGIFPENCDINDIWIDIQSKCNLKKSQIDEIGEDGIYVDLRDTSDIIHSLGGIVTVHAGKKTNTIENIKNNHDYKLKIKTDLLSQNVDILEIGKPDIDVLGYKNVVFPAIGFEMPIIVCSDNHNINNYETKENLWIKAEPTFEGLKQIIYEPSDRVSIETENPNNKFTKPTFGEITNSNETIIFEDDDRLSFKPFSIPLNPNLVSIIGGRGEGKSILVDYIAGGFGYSDENYKVSDNFNVKYFKTLNTLDDVLEFKFTDNNNLDFLYIKQNEVKDKALKPKELGRELRRMLNIEDISFSNIVQVEIEEAVNKVSELELWFQETNDNDVKINDKETLNSLRKKNKDLLSSITNKDNKEKLEEYTNNITKIQIAENKKKKLEQLEADLNDFMTSTNSLINDLDPQIPKISFKLQLDKISEIKRDLKTEIKNSESSNAQIKEKFADIYKGDLSALLSNADKYKRNISTIDNRLVSVKEKEIEFKKLTEEKAAIADKILNEITRQVKIINEAWTDLLNNNDDWTIEQSQLMKKIISDRDIKVEGKIYFDTTQFYIGLRDCVNGRKWKKKNQEGELENHFEITDYISYCDFLKNHIFSELEENGEYYNEEQFEEYFYSLDKRSEYLSVLPQITYKGKTLDKISVGQRGTVYLCLKLATNAFSTPIVFDQPEDDLDNLFIINELVDIFKELKKYRQVIIVTHNANLVVNADSEQVIVAKNIEEKLDYVSGSLENSEIITQVCEILEGGKQAFEQRKKKYKII